MAEKPAGKTLTQKEWDKLNPEVQYQGRHITLPAEPGKMALRVAHATIARMIQDEEQEFRVNEMFDAHPLDAAVAFHKAMCQLHGWASPQSQQSMFGMQAPTMLTVKTGFRDEDVVQVPIGEFRLPNIPEPITTTIHAGCFVVYATIKKRDRHTLLEIVTLAKQILKTESIYLGKALRIHVDDDGDLDRNPEFIDVSDITEAGVLFDDEVQQMVETNIFTPIKHHDACVAANIPVKRTVLLEGPYGVGKSLLARLIGRIAQDNGCTFILIDKVQGLRNALEFGKRYQGQKLAVVFAEDVDRVTSERDEATNDLVNTIDGVVSKNSRLMTILTTNHVEKIERVVLRHGRFDAIISLRPPSAKTVGKLIHLYAGELLSGAKDVGAASRELEGCTASSIRECVERAKLGMISRGDNKLNGSDLLVAARTMKVHLNLLEDKPTVKSDGEVLAETFKRVVGNGQHEVITDIQDKVIDLHNRII